jgi:hypothetical protein
MSNLHPLAADEVRPISGWQEWRKLWQETKVAEIRHSLLHFGFEVETRAGESAERTIFYLSIADGFDTSHDVNFASKGDHRPPHFSSFGRSVESTEKIRRMVARKAFDMLCQHVFKKDKAERSLDERSVWWVQRLANPAVFEAMLHFFRIDDRNRVRNLPVRLEPDHKAEIAEGFLVELTKLGWKGHIYERHIGEDGVRLFADARPRFVEILCAMRRPDLLLTQEYTGGGFTRLETIDEESLHMLEKIVMDQELDIPFENGDRKPKTTEEAAASGSRAAIVCMVLKSRAKEFERLRHIRELEDERIRVERQLEKAKA